MSSPRPPEITTLLGLDGKDLSLVLTVEEQFEKSAEVIAYLERLAEASRTMTAEQKAKIRWMRGELEDLKTQRERLKKASTEIL